METTTDLTSKNGMHAWWKHMNFNNKDMVDSAFFCVDRKIFSWYAYAFFEQALKCGRQVFRRNLSTLRLKSGVSFNGLCEYFENNFYVPVLNDEGDSQYFLAVDNNTCVRFQCYYNSSKTVSAVVYSCDKKKYDMLVEDLFENLVYEGDDEHQHFIVCRGPNGYSLNIIDKACTDLIRENYNEDVVEGIEKIKYSYNQESSDSGRLVLVQGPPGTGKTHLVRGLSSEVKSSFVFIPSFSVKDVLSGNFLSFISKSFSNTSNSITFFIEDGDMAIRERDGSNNEIVSSILNMTSGLISDCFNFRVIITTNESIDNIDPALLRDGRLAYHLNVDELTADRAQNAYRRLVGDENAEYTGSRVLSDIYAAANEVGKISNKSSKNSKNKIGF